MTLRSTLESQFQRPRGPLGYLAGVVMASRASNRERNQWTVGLLALEPNHKILEIGCGPEVALKACALKVSEGHACGIDHSEVMVHQARHRLAPEIKTGHASVRLGGLSDFALEPQSYDRVYSVNVVQFFPDISEGFKQIDRCLIEHGKVATTYQPRSKNPTRESAVEMAIRIETAMKAVGFVEIERHELSLEPVPATCVIGRKAMSRGEGQI